MGNKKFPHRKGPERTSADRAEEQWLLKKLVDGDQQIWSSFYKKYHPLIRRCVVRALCRSGLRFTEADLEDIVAEVWLALLRYDRRKLRKFDANRAGLSNWLGILATNCTIDHIRGQTASKRTPTALEPQPGWTTDPEAEAWLDHDQKVNIALRAASRLSPREQRFLSMCLEERVPAELARELGIAVGTVHTRKHRLCQKLSRLVGQLSQAQPAMAS